MVISVAVEGLVDEALARRMISHVGGSTGTVYGRKGKPDLRKRISGFNEAAKRGPWFVLVDLNGEHDCAPAPRAAWVPHPAPDLCFRVAVRAVEAWLIADSENLSAFLRISQNRIPRRPEELGSPKRTMIELAARSRSRPIRQDMAPRPGTGRSVGAAYTSRLIEFLDGRWNPETAARRSDSLRRAMSCLEQQIARCQ